MCGGGEVTLKPEGRLRRDSSELCVQGAPETGEEEGSRVQLVPLSIQDQAGGRCRHREGGHNLFPEECSSHFDLVS